MGADGPNRRRIKNGKTEIKSSTCNRKWFKATRKFSTKQPSKTRKNGCLVRDFRIGKNENFPDDPRKIKSERTRMTEKYTKQKWKTPSFGNGVCWRKQTGQHWPIYQRRNWRTAEPRVSWLLISASCGTEQFSLFPFQFAYTLGVARTTSGKAGKWK